MTSARAALRRLLGMVVEICFGKSVTQSMTRILTDSILIP
jgi:hypothetical protein